MYADFHNCEEELNNNLKDTKEKVQSLEVTLRRSRLGAKS
jgi:hypothetical protein